MKSWWINEQAQCELREIDTPQPGPGQLLLRVRAAALNRGEFIVGHGLTKAGTAKALGLEGAGEVVAVGPGVHTWRPGDRVMGRFSGAFAEHALVSEAEALPIPPQLSFTDAAAVPLAFILAHDMLVLQGRLRHGGWLLVTGVSSGVGVAALQLAKAIGAHVIGTSGSQAKLDLLQRVGLDVALCMRTPDFHADVMRATQDRGVDLVVNTVGGSLFAECQRCMAFEGRLATVGYVDGVLDAKIDLQALHARRQVFFGVSNKLMTPAMKAAAAERFAGEVLPIIAQGRIRPLVDRVFDFGQLPEARAHMEANAHVGKIVVAVEEK